MAWSRVTLLFSLFAFMFFTRNVFALGAFQGFGVPTSKVIKEKVFVTSLADSGAGSLREAVSQSNRHIVFSVEGTISLNTEITIKKSNLFIDGLSAPGAGITIVNKGLILRNAADVTIQGIRIRKASKDGIWVTDGSRRIMIDRVSVQGSGDGNIDITRDGTRDITVSRSILAQPAGEEKNMLIAFRATRVTLHHNVFVESNQRNPQVTFDDSDARTHDTETTLDMRNNLISGWGSHGSRIRYGANANIVNNYYDPGTGPADKALVVCKGLTNDSACYSDATNKAEAFVSGNIGSSSAINNEGTTSQPFSAPEISLQTALKGACNAYDIAGRRPLDAIDAKYIKGIKRPACL